MYRSLNSCATKWTRRISTRQPCGTCSAKHMTTWNKHCIFVSFITNATRHIHRRQIWRGGDCYRNHNLLSNGSFSMGGCVYLYHIFGINLIQLAVNISIGVVGSVVANFYIDCIVVIRPCPIVIPLPFYFNR